MNENDHPQETAMVPNAAAQELADKIDQLPSVMPDGTFMATLGPKYMKNCGIAVFHMIGGVGAFAEWANRNKDDFYKSIYPKLLGKEVEINDRRSIEDVITDIDDEGVIDADYERV